MRNIKVESPSANGAVSFHLISTRTGEAISSPEILSPDRNAFSLSVASGEDVSLVWRRLGNRNEVMRLGADAQTVTLSDPTLSGPLIDEVYGEEETLPAVRPRRAKRKSKVTREEEDEEYEDGVDGDGDGDVSYAFEDDYNARPTSYVQAVQPAWVTVGENSARKLMERADARQKALEPADRFSATFENSLRKFARKSALKSAGSGLTREAGPETAWFATQGVDEKTVPISVISETTPLGALSIGAATDTSPARYGGWVPYRGRQPIKVRRRFGRLAFEIAPPETGPDLTPDADSKLRFTIAAANRKQVRFLVPRFAQGTRVTMVGEGISNYEVRFEVEPIDPKLQVVMQSLVVADAADARLVEPLVRQTAESMLPNLLHHVADDPWAAIVIGLAIRRHKWAIDCSWCPGLALQFPWISDALVLAGWWYSTSAGGRDLNEAIEFLSRARRLGAPYFAETNAILRDLLVWLSVDAADESLKALAGRELGLWRSKVPYQSWAGATFAWVVDRSTQNGRLDRKRDLPIYKGELSDLVGSTDPNKGRFGGSPRSNGRVLSAVLSPGRNENWTHVELKVESDAYGAPLTGEVEFHLHPTFSRRIETKSVRRGAAVHAFEAWGVFTVGAVADGGKTRLELDLSEMAGSDLFRSR